MFVDQLIKLHYGPDKTIPISVSFTYNAPVFSLKVKVRTPGCSNTRDTGDTSPGTLLQPWTKIGKQTDLNDTPEPMSLPINDLP